MPKIYLKLEVDFDGDEDVVKLNRYGAQARGLRDLLVSAWRYCKRGVTDGHVPAEQFGLLVYPDTLKNGLRDAERLVECGIAERTETGYYFPGYLKHNPSKAQLAEIAAKKAEAGKIGGKASGLVRKVEAEPKHDASPVRSQTSDFKPQTSDDKLHSEISSSGERTETLRLVPDTDPPKNRAVCSRHPNGNPNDDPCGGCQRVSEAARKDDDRATQKRADEAVRARLGCPRCEGMGFILDDDKKPTKKRCDPHVVVAANFGGVSG